MARDEGVGFAYASSIEAEVPQLAQDKGLDLVLAIREIGHTASFTGVTILDINLDEL